MTKIVCDALSCRNAALGKMHRVLKGLRAGYGHKTTCLIIVLCRACCMNAPAKVQPKRGNHTERWCALKGNTCLTLGGPIIMPFQWVSDMSSSSTNPQLIVPSPPPFCPSSNSSRRRKLRGTTATRWRVRLTFAIHAYVRTLTPTWVRIHLFSRSQQPLSILSPPAAAMCGGGYNLVPRPRPQERKMVW